MKDIEQWQWNKDTKKIASPKELMRSRGKMVDIH